MKINKNKTILVWRWDDAPDEFRSLSQRVGNGEWVAFVPWEIWEIAGRDLSNIRWLNSKEFSCVEVEIYDSEDGEGVVFIGEPWGEPGL